MKMVRYFVFVVLLSLPAFAQNVTFESYRKAREVLDRSIRAYGGLEKLRAIENVTFRVEGDTVHRNQSRRTFALDRTPFKASYIIDAKNMRFRQSQEGSYPGGYNWVNGFAMNKTEGVSWNVLRGSMSPISNIQPANFRGRLRMFPQFIILNAATRASRLRSTGRTTFDGRAHDVVSYANKTGSSSRSTSIRRRASYQNTRHSGPTHIRATWSARSYSPLIASRTVNLCRPDASTSAAMRLRVT